MATQDYQITNTLLQSLFEPSPEQKLQAYQKARDQQAMQFAQLSPGQGAVFAGAQLAQDLGKSAGELGGAVRRGVFGIQTPKEIEDNVANQIKAKAQPLLQQGDVAGYADFLATEYAKAGLTDRAVRAKTAAEQFRYQQQERQATLGLTEAKTQQARAAADKSGREGRTPLADRLVALDTKAATQGLNAAEEAEKTALERVVKLQAPKGTTIDLGKAFGEAEQKESAKASVEAYNQLGSAYVASSKTLRDIDVVEGIIDDTFRGGASNLAVSASKLASAAGVNVPKTASNTEVLKALFGKLVIPLVKQFPGALAVKELEALERTQPQTLNEPETIKYLLDLAKQDLQVIQKVYTKAAQYKKDNNESTKGFDFNLETGKVYGTIAEAKALTPQRIAELAKTEEGKKKLAELKPFLPRR